MKTMISTQPRELITISVPPRITAKAAALAAATENKTTANVIEDEVIKAFGSDENAAEAETILPALGKAAR